MVTSGMWFLSVVPLGGSPRTWLEVTAGREGVGSHNTPRRRPHRSCFIPPGTSPAPRREVAGRGANSYPSPRRGCGDLWGTVGARDWVGGAPPPPLPPSGSSGLLLRGLVLGLQGELLFGVIRPLPLGPGGRKRSRRRVQRAWQVGQPPAEPELRPPARPVSQSCCSFFCPCTHPLVPHHTPVSNQNPSSVSPSPS